MARIEEAMISVKGDTMYLRKGFDGFKETYWKKLAETSGKVGGLSALTSFIVAIATIVAAKKLWP